MNVMNDFYIFCSLKAEKLSNKTLISMIQHRVNEDLVNVSIYVKILTPEINFESACFHHRRFLYFIRNFLLTNQQ